MVHDVPKLVSNRLCPYSLTVTKGLNLIKRTKVYTVTAAKMYSKKQIHIMLEIVLIERQEDYVRYQRHLEVI